jgi:predicted nucleic acid-binding protein
LSFVLDASMALAAILEDESVDQGRAALARAAIAGAWVPAIWHLEVANALQMSVKRGRCSAVFADESLARLALVPIEVDPDTAIKSWHETLALARAESLTLYDAAYLELALRRGIELASLDKQLNKAAVRRGVPLVFGSDSGL